MPLAPLLRAGMGALAFGCACAQAQTTKITTEYLMTLYAPLEQGQEIDASLFVFNLRKGGWVKGPKISGTLISPGGDWFRVLPDGTGRLDVRGTIKTDDGALIYISYNGIVSQPKDSAEREEKGEVLTSKDEYFLTAPTMQTASQKYAWLTHVQCVGKMVEVKSAGNDSFVKYDIFIVR